MGAGDQSPGRGGGRSSRAIGGGVGPASPAGDAVVLVSAAPGGGAVVSVSASPGGGAVVLVSASASSSDGAGLFASSAAVAAARQAGRRVGAGVVVPLFSVGPVDDLDPSTSRSAAKPVLEARPSSVVGAAAEAPDAAPSWWEAATSCSSGGFDGGRVVLVPVVAPGVVVVSSGGLHGGRVALVPVVAT